MNYIKRAVNSLIFHIKNSLIILLIFIVISSLILAGFSSMNASKKAASETRNTIGATVMINNYHTDSYDRYQGVNVIKQEAAEKISESPLINGIEPYIYSFASETEDIKAITTDYQREYYDDSIVSGIRIEGTNNVYNSAGFLSNNYIMQSGSRNFKETDRMKAIITSDLAEESNLELGDSFSLKTFYLPPEYNGEDVNLEIVGIFAIERPLEKTDAPYFNSENLIFVTPDAAYSLNGTTDVFSLKCSVIDPLKASSFVNDVRKMDIDDIKDYIFIIDDTEYRGIEATLNAMTNIAFVLLIFSIVIGIVVLTLIIMIRLKDRDYEIGVLLSMGESKIKIITQLILESLIPIIVAMIISVVINQFTSSFILNFFSEGIITGANTVTPIIAMFLSVIILVVLASIPTIRKVLTYKPKDMLMGME